MASFFAPNTEGIPLTKSTYDDNFPIQVSLSFIGIGITYRDCPFKLDFTV